MKVEQLQIMKVIEFSKNRYVENIKKSERLDVAIKFLEYLVDEGADFHIVINKEAALKLFEDNDGKLREYLIMTSNLEKARNIKIDKNACVYVIEGDELD